MQKTTDNQNELFDVVDTNDNVIGQATRGEVHKNKKLIHRSVGVVIFNSRGEIFLQQRSAFKDTDPLKWTISCSGHVGTAGPAVRVSQGRASSHSSRHKVGTHSPFGEARLGIPRSRHPLELIYEKAAHRELQEELGADLEIEPVCKYLCRGLHETEMVMLYKIEISKEVEPLWRFHLNRDEILQGKFFSRKKLNEAVRTGKIKLSYSGEMALGKVGWIEI